MLPRSLSTGVSRYPTGAMRHTIELLQPNTTRDSDGEFADPTVFATCRAFIVNLQGRELLKAQQVVSEVTNKVIIPYIPGVTSAMMVSFDSRLFEVLAVSDLDELKVQLVLYCVERNDGV